MSLLVGTRVPRGHRTRAPLVDLHLHTTCSDGLLSPTELVARAKESKLRSICLTDHDTLDGFAEAREAGARLDIEVLPGCEISCDHRGREIHILGLLVDPDYPELCESLARFREERRQHLPRILKRLAELGLPLTEAEVRHHASAEFVGRPHIARAMIARGYVSHLEQAFNQYLGTRAPAYVSRQRITAADAIALILAAGGVPVIAHPGVYDYGEKEIGHLHDVGLAGIEVLHPDHNESRRGKYAAIARTRGMLMTGGSDYHGGDRWKTRLQPGSMGVPDLILDEVRQQARSHHA